jgi:hypothetical protein
VIRVNIGLNLGHLVCVLAIILTQDNQTVLYAQSSAATVRTVQQNVCPVTTPTVFLWAPIVHASLAISRTH